MQEISQDYQVTKGDIIEFHYKVESFWAQEQLDSLISSINSEGKMGVLESGIYDESFYDPLYGETPISKLRIRVQVLQNPFPVMVLIALIISLAGAIMLYLSLDKIYLIAKEAPSIIPGITSTVSLGILAFLLMAGFLIFRKRS